LNPTVAGTFTYSGITDSAVEVAYGATANTVTGGTGTLLASGFCRELSQASASLPTTLYIGSKIDGTRDTLVLCATVLTGSFLDVYGSLSWRELE